MSDSHLRCSKCGGEMKLGFVVDKDHGGQTISKWAPGVPHKSFWTGTKLDKDDVIPIGTYRCSSCGFLESYARPEFAVQ